MLRVPCTEKWTFTCLVMPYGNIPFCPRCRRRLKIWNPQRYRQPSPLPNYSCISIGDVGFIHDGKFNLVFSAGSPQGQRQPGVDVPVGFQQLQVGDPVIQEREPGCLHTNAVKYISFFHNPSGFTPLYVSVSRHSKPFSKYQHRPRGMFTFNLTGDRGAALVTRHKTHRKDSPGDLERSFEEYIKLHYKSWIEFARHQLRPQDTKLVLVSGFDVTKDFSMVSYSHEGDVYPRHSFTISKPMFPSTSREFRGEWSFDRMTHFNDARRVSPAFDQCVFVRYYTMRFRALFGPKVTRAGTSSRDPAPADKQGWTFPESTTQPDAGSSIADEGDPGGWHTGGAEFDSGDNVSDDWDVIAGYVFQVIRLPMPSPSG